MKKWTEEKILEFKKFNSEQKRWKLLAIFEYIKDEIDFAGNVTIYLSNSPDDLVMDKLYELVMEYADHIRDEKSKQIEKNERYIEKIEKQDSEDADKLLSWILELI